MAGRMLTRTSGGVTTTFLWDGWDCIRESTPTSTTHYLIPEGQLLGFRRDGEQYSVASDALGCVRLVTDSSGEVVFRRDYGAFGETLPGGFDNVPGGMPYSFVGGLGVRTDADSGLIYMRQRWYCSTLQRFISRDPIGSENSVHHYAYCHNTPLDRVDPSGLQGTILPGGTYVGPGMATPATPTIEDAMVRFARNSRCCEIARKFKLNPAAVCSVGFHEFWFYNPFTWLENKWVEHGHPNYKGTFGPLGLGTKDIDQLIRRAPNDLPEFADLIAERFGGLDAEGKADTLLNLDSATEFFAAFQTLRVKNPNASAADQAEAILQGHNPGTTLRGRMIGYRVIWEKMRARYLNGFSKICEEQCDTK